MNISQIKKTIKQHQNILENAHHVKRLGIFGSTARGESSEDSDIDIIVELSQPTSFFNFLELENFLSKILGKKIDLVTKKALKPAIKQEILKETLYV